jgi:hypothetical protein
MPQRQCHHCKEWIDADAPHDCWTTTESALTGELSDELQEAYERLRETAASFGEQRIYASHHCIMFSRKACYFFVRPKPSALEICIFLGRALEAPQVRSARATSKTKIAHILHIRHRDEVEPPITDWIREAYEASDHLSTPKGRLARISKPADRAQATRRDPKKIAGASRRVTAGKRGKRTSSGRTG